MRSKYNCSEFSYASTQAKLFTSFKWHTKTHHSMNQSINRRSAFEAVKETFTCEACIAWSVLVIASSMYMRILFKCQESVSARHLHSKKGFAVLPENATSYQSLLEKKHSFRQRSFLICRLHLDTSFKQLTKIRASC